MATLLHASQQMSLTHFVVLSSLTPGAMRLLPGDRHLTQQDMTAFDNLRVGTRLGRNPQILVTTTPKRVPLLYKLIEESKTGRVVITRGSTLDNSGNLSGAYLDAITGVYAGTRLAAQELYGEMLDDVEGALWTEELIESHRQSFMPQGTPLRIIGVDPSVAENPRDELWHRCLWCNCRQRSVSSRSLGTRRCFHSRFP